MYSNLNFAIGFCSSFFLLVLGKRQQTVSVQTLYACRGKRRGDSVSRVGNVAGSRDVLVIRPLVFQAEHCAIGEETGDWPAQERPAERQFCHASRRGCPGLWQPCSQEFFRRELSFPETSQDTLPRANSAPSTSPAAAEPTERGRRRCPRGIAAIAAGAPGRDDSPLHAEPANPTRGTGNAAGEEIQEPADPDHDLRPQFRQVAANPKLLARSAEGHQHQVGAAAADVFDHLRPLPRRRSNRAASRPTPRRDSSWPTSQRLPRPRPDDRPAGRSACRCLAGRRPSGERDRCR